MVCSSFVCGVGSREVVFDPGGLKQQKKSVSEASVVVFGDILRAPGLGLWARGTVQGLGFRVEKIDAVGVGFQAFGVVGLWISGFRMFLRGATEGLF